MGKVLMRSLGSSVQGLLPGICALVHTVGSISRSASIDGGSCPQLAGKGIELRQQLWWRATSSAMVLLYGSDLMNDAGQV